MKHLATIVILTIFSNTLMGQTLIPFRLVDKWGYSDENKKLIIEPSFDEAGVFGTNVAWIKKGDKYGFINRSGALVTGMDYSEVSKWAYTNYLVVKNGEKICIDREGKEIECTMVCGGDFMLTSYFTTTKKGDKIGIYKNRNERFKARGNKNYKPELYPQLWDEFIENYTGYAAVKSGMIWSVIDKGGVIVTDVKYDSIAVEPKFTYQKNHYFMVVKDGKFGFLDMNGKMAVEPKYMRLEFYDTMLAKAWVDENFWGYIDEKGNEYFEK